MIENAKRKSTPRSPKSGGKQKKYGRKIFVVLAGLLALSVIAGCARGTIEYIEVSPSCRPAERPVLPIIDAGELWDAVGENVYRRLEFMIQALTTWGLENEAALREVCHDE